MICALNFENFVKCRFHFRDKVAKYSVKLNIDAFVYLAFRNNEAGTAGIAYHRTTCGNPDGRTSLNEYLENDLISGQVLSTIQWS